MITDVFKQLPGVANERNNGVIISEHLYIKVEANINDKSEEKLIGEISRGNPCICLPGIKRTRREETIERFLLNRNRLIANFFEAISSVSGQETSKSLELSKKTAYFIAE